MVSRNFVSELKSIQILWILKSIPIFSNYLRDNEIVPKYFNDKTS